jgi:hypothetical protein
MSQSPHTAAPNSLNPADIPLEYAQGLLSRLANLLAFASIHSYHQVTTNPSMALFLLLNFGTP